jgi:hypothetical protein
MNQNMPEPDDRRWESGWDDHQLQQMLRASKLSLIEKIQWLEEAHDLVLQLQKSRSALNYAQKAASESKPPVPPPPPSEP